MYGGRRNPAAADFMQKSTTVRFLLFHRCANFFDYNTDFAIFDFDYFTDVPISYFFSTITRTLPFSISTGFRKWFFYLLVFVSAIWRIFVFADSTRSLHAMPGL